MNTINKQLSQIKGVDDKDTMARRVDWFNKYEDREVYLEKLRKDGKKGKEYSDAVVEYDKYFV